METAAHYALKGFAMALLHQCGCRAMAVEVRCPISRYRIDVAGWQDIAFPRTGGQRGLDASHAYPRRCEPRTIFVECKQSRADYLRDRGQLERVLAQREMLLRQKHELEERELKVREPGLRQGGASLFTSMDEWDFSAARSPKYRRILAEIAKLERQLTGSTKFWYLAHHNLADQMLIAAPVGLIRCDELPIGWGLAECPQHLLADPPRKFTRWPVLGACVTIAAPNHKASPQHRQRVLRNIAVAATFASARLGSFRRQNAIPTEQ
jgi:hypothetical protein